MNQKDGVIIYENNADNLSESEGPLDSMRYLDGGKISKRYQIVLKNKQIEEMSNISFNTGSPSSSYIDNGLNN